MYEEDGLKRRRVSDWASLAQERIALLQAERVASGEPPLTPVIESSRKLARKPWGAAWMRQMAYCEQSGFALSRGRTLLRHGCVLDIQIDDAGVHALVSADELYHVDLNLTPLDGEKQDRLKEQCSSHIDSLMALLSGKVDESVMAQLCEPEQGLLPLAHEWQMSCDCPEWNEPCVHAAAAIYALGCLIDQDAELLFRLRRVDPQCFCELPHASSTDFDAQDLGDLFDIDIDLVSDFGSNY